LPPPPRAAPPLRPQPRVCRPAGHFLIMAFRAAVSAFVDKLVADPSAIAKPELAFLREGLTKLGVKLPSFPAAGAAASGGAAAGGAAEKPHSPPPEGKSTPSAAAAGAAGDAAMNDDDLPIDEN